MAGRPRGLSKALRTQVYFRFNGCCLGCGVVLYHSQKSRPEDEQWHVHHVVPRSDGGSDELDNLAALCLDCHTRAEDMRPMPPSLIGLRKALRYVADPVESAPEFVGTPERPGSCDDWPDIDWRKWVYGGHPNPFKDGAFIRHRRTCVRCAAA